MENSDNPFPNSDEGEQGAPFSQPLYAAPSDGPTDSGQVTYHPRQSLSLTEAYTYVMEIPDWIVSLLLLMLFSFIPYIGMLLVMGYQFERIPRLLRNPGERQLNCTFDDFSKFLYRGVWPFLVFLIPSVIVAPVLAIGFYIFAAITAGLGVAAGEGALIVVPVMILLSFLAMAAVILIVFLVTIPMMMSAAFQRNFSAGFDTEFIKDFVGKMWKEIIISQLFLMVTGMVGMFVGFFLVCVGAYFAMAWVQMAQMHLYYQLYEIYLTRGGRPLPFQELPKNL